MVAEEALRHLLGGRVLCCKDEGLSRVSVDWELLRAPSRRLLFQVRWRICGLL